MLNFAEMQRALGKEPLEKSDGFDIKHVVIDSREVKNDSCFVGISGECFDGNDFAPEAWKNGCRVFVLDVKKARKLLSDLPQSTVFGVSDTVEALGHLAKAYRHSIFTQTMVITGSSGKTTTRRMISLLLEQKFRVFTARKNLNNEIGLPLSMLETPPDTYVSVLEMGMNHSGEIAYLAKIAEPLVALITNIGYAHIGNLGSLEAIADAKSEVFEGLNPRGFVFLNREDPFFEYLRLKSPVEVKDFGVSDFEVLENRGIDGYLLKYKGIEFEFSLPGEHHLEDLAGAFAVADFYGILPTQMTKVIGDFQPISGRLEILRGNFILINDCYNANPSSMRASLGILKYSGEGRKVAVLADMLELGKFAAEEHLAIARWMVQERVADKVFLYGKEFQAVVSVFEEAGIEVLWFESLEEMVAQTEKKIQTGDVVLVKASRGMHLEKVIEVLSQKI